jgi:hypothetical protein
VRLRSKLTGLELSAAVRPELRHARYGYPLLQAHGSAGTIVIRREDAALFEVVEATPAERQALTDAGYSLDG